MRRSEAFALLLFAVVCVTVGSAVLFTPWVLMAAGVAAAVVALLANVKD